MEEQRIKQIGQDMKLAVDKVYWPLTTECYVDMDYKYIDYDPLFYFDSKCNEISFGVHFHGKEPQYPLTCTSAHYSGQFVVESPEDWENHTDKFVAWKKEIQEMMQKIRSA